MKSQRSSSLAVFYDRDLPCAATHCEQHLCGFSIYKSVLVRWDEDHDSRILILIDQIPWSLRERLLVVQEHEAGVSMLWADQVPDEYKDGTELLVDGDVWHVMQSYTPSADGRTAEDFKGQRSGDEIPF